MAEPIDLPFGLWTRVGLKEAQVQVLFSIAAVYMANKVEYNGIRQVAAMCPHRRTHWRHLANTILPSSAAAMRPYVKFL